ncbi:MAG: cobalamin biosynthesis protein CobW [Actinobacteria bacterium]|uniref:Unannotated protein n=1 Tax=freshwater metagenome TaxID=449393 RepID=A0A6J6QZT6_9ZZZZ|nr:cobalamin biosynthesis protein CobW [Actinomycetota bacterium]
MSTPVVLITGVDPGAMAAAMVSLQFDLRHAVAVRHHIDPERQVLQRVVSDVTGIVEQEEIELAHACVSCALREDIIPTLDRVAGDGRWAHVVAHLPIGAEATQVCDVLAWETRLAHTLHVASVVTVLSGRALVDDLLGDDLLVERGHHSSHDDHRGVGEVAGAMIEYADVVVIADECGPVAVDLVRTLARPDAEVVLGCDQLDAGRLATRLHRHERTHAWSSPMRGGPLPPAASPQVWVRDLRSGAGFHPQRLLDGLDALGGGRHRSRGCFWLPTRPGQALVWDGAGGQLSIGAGQPWRRATPMTRIVLVGTGTAPAHLDAAFADLLLRPDESGRGRYWEVSEDGFEPWLGPVRGAA